MTNYKGKPRSHLREDLSFVALKIGDTDHLDSVSMADIIKEIREFTKGLEEFRPAYRIDERPDSLRGQVIVKQVGEASDYVVMPTETFDLMFETVYVEGLIYDDLSLMSGGPYQRDTHSSSEDTPIVKRDVTCRDASCLVCRDWK